MRLHRVAALAWAGLFLNSIVAAIVHFSPQLYIQGYTLFSADTVAPLLPFIQGALLVQAASIILLWLRVPGAILLAWASALVLLPASLIFIEGCGMTRQRTRYACFDPAPHAPEDFGLLYANSSPEKAPHIGLGVMLTGVLFYMLGIMSVIGTLMLVMGAILVIRSKRMRTRPVLGLYDQYFVVTPNTWAETYAIPYRNVRSYLLKSKRIFLVVEDVAGQEQELVIPLRSIDPEDRDDAISSFTSRLAMGTQLFSQTDYYG